jgi:hypothetical protein
MMKSVALVSSIAIVAAANGCMMFPAPQTVPSPVRGARGVSGIAGDSARPNPNDPRPYPRVITRDAKTRAGMFKTHIVGDRLYFEIPRQELNRDMLMVGRFERAAVTPGDFEGLWRRPVHRARSEVGAIGESRDSEKSVICDYR